MKQTDSRFYMSRWDIWTMLVVVVTVILCSWPMLTSDIELWPMIICIASLLFVVIALASVHYRIEGNQLLVYVLFTHKTFPIDNIATIEATNSALSAPAAALTGRIAITFNDKKPNRAYNPLIISPVRPSEFIAQLQSVNPEIKVKV